MTYAAIITSLMLIQLFYLGYKVGLARGKYGVNAPATSGDPMFERAYRIHQNTFEQLIIVIPALWIFAMYVHALSAAGLGLVFIIGRVIYEKAYLADPKSRGTGFMIGVIPTAILMFGGLIGAIITLVKSGQYI
jgi:uncharacterized MAPEG superfamily protein